MFLIDIVRFGDTPYGMFGKLSLSRNGTGIKTDTTIYTVERNWVHNAANVSCIPEGVYEAILGTFRGKYPDLELQDVPNRSAIEIHRANLASELQGCIAVGCNLGMYRGKWAVLNSTIALNMIMRSIKDEEIIIVEIRSTGIEAAIL